MKARGKGIGNRIETVEYMIRRALPESVTLEYDFTDDEQDRQAAEIHEIETRTLKSYFDMGALNVIEVKALAVAKGILDGEILDTLQQPLTSDDNPEDATDAPAENPVEDDDESEVKPTDKPPSTEEEKALKTFADYRRSLRSLTRGYWTGDLAAFDFMDGMFGSINRHFEQAWRQVEAQYGISPDERTQASQDRLNLAINTEVGYVAGFADAIEANSKANGGALTPLLDRAELWANGYDRIIQLAQLVIAPDIKMVWEYGKTIEHCEDCAQYVGKVFFKSQWEAAGAIPQSPNLACSGIQCNCRLTPTTERKTRGEVPPLIGHKHLHAVA
jgi:hypothetical protein